MLAKDVKKMSASQKAELYCLLREDEELRNYMISNNILFEELTRRDKAYTEGKLKLTTRRQLSSRLKKRRDAL